MGGKIVAELAPQASSWYNRVLNNVVSGSAANTPDRKHLNWRCLMDMIPPHSFSQQELSFSNSSQEMKCCSKCGEVKPLSAFPKRNNRRSGIQPHCLHCHAERIRDYSKAHPEYAQNSNLLRNYDLTLREYEAILAFQGGTCKVCGGPPLGKGRYHVDHDHVTGKIRGLLCHKCNVALGMVQDNTDHLKALIAYLEEFS